MKTSMWVNVAVQLGATWAVGSIALPVGWNLLLLTAFAGGRGPFVVLALVGVVGVLAYLIVVITTTRSVSVLGASVGGRVLWALVVLGVGTVGWALGWAITDAAGVGLSRNPLLTFLFGGVPFALVAGLLLHGWPRRAPAIGLSVVLIGAAVVALRHETPEEFDARLALNGVSRETAYAVRISGYAPTNRDYGDGLGGANFAPTDRGAIPPDRYLTIMVSDRVLPGEQLCGQPTAQDARLAFGDCAIEPDGLVYRHNEFEHGYQVPVGPVYVTVAATLAVDRDLVRIAARSVHVATVDEFGGHEQTGNYYAATVPGYTSQLAGAPAGLVYLPADHTGNGAQSVAITLHATDALSESVCFDTTECTPDGAGLTYVRREDTHGFVLRRGRVNVRVLGGLRTDRALLRQATLDARPATDDELRRALPPPRPHSFLDRLRQWVRSF